MSPPPDAATHSLNDDLKQSLTLCAPPPDAAAHSLNDDMVISRQMMMATGSTICLGARGAGGLVVSRIRAVVTWNARVHDMHVCLRAHVRLLVFVYMCVHV